MDTAAIGRRVKARIRGWAWVASSRFQSCPPSAYRSRVNLTSLDTLSYPSPVFFEIEFQLNYLEFPILARITPRPGTKVQPVILFGPVVGFKTGADFKTTEAEESFSNNVTEGYATMTMGLLAGLGVSVQMGPRNFLTVQARLYQGLTNPMEYDQHRTMPHDIGFFAGMEFLLN